MQLTKNNYHSIEANKFYMSVSQYKGFLDCEAKEMAKIKGEYIEKSSDAMLIGNYIHAWAEGAQAFGEFKETNKDTMFKKNGELLCSFKHAEKMIETIKNDKFCMFLLQGEKEVIMTANIFDVDWKIKIDILNINSKRFIDIKTIANIFEKIYSQKLQQKVSFVEAYNYILQMIVYAEIIKRNTGDNFWFEPLILAISKEEIPDKAIISLKDDARFEFELEQIALNIPRIINIKNGILEPKRCEKCNYCKDTKILKNIINYNEI